MKNTNISHLAILLGTFLVLTIAVATGVSVKILYDKAIDDWSLQARNTARILSESTAQQMTSAYLALDGVVDRFKLRTPDDDADLRLLFANEATFQLLHDKASTSPQIDVISLVAKNGDVVNFSRKWPTPKINLAERDYFKAHRDNPKLNVLVSEPVRNKGNGKWTFYLSRRINDPAGQFLGLVLLGISTEYYSDFYARISLDGKASITLLRDDFMIMARWPVKEEILGKYNLKGSTWSVIHEQRKTEGVMLTDAPRKSSNDESGHPRMGAVRTVQKYPLIINYTIDEEVYLGVWRQNTRLIVLLAASSILALLFSFSLLVRALQRREQDLVETLRLKQDAERSAHEKSLLLESLSHNQQALRDSSEHMSAIVDNAPDAILIIDEARTIVSCNRAAEAIFGANSAALLGQQADTLFLDAEVLTPAGDSEKLVEAERLQQGLAPDPAATLAPLAAAGASIESTATRINGRHFPCDISKAAFRLSGHARQVLIVRDITERKNMERAKNEFVSIVSHELRTPLTAIRGSLGLLRGGVAGELPKLGADMVAMACDNTERLARMINDLLDMQKMEAGMMEFEFAMHSLFRLLQSAVASNQPYGAQCGVTILIDGEVPDVQLHVDEGRFQQVMSNLLSNACKFSPHGSSVLVSASLLADQVRVDIKDSGSGIPAEFRSKMFQRFAQADSSDTRKKGGTGLGLSITRDIMLLMQGNIDYESAPGQGTTFFITLPLPSAAVTATCASAPDAKAE